MKNSPDQQRVLKSKVEACEGFSKKYTSGWTISALGTAGNIEMKMQWLDSHGSLTKCPPPICFKFTGVKGDSKE